jgi:hypothetical protein
MVGYHPEKGHAIFCILVSVAMITVPGPAPAREKKKDWEIPKTFTLEEQGIELVLNGGWASQPPPLGKDIVKMLLSLRDLSQIILTPLPFQVLLSQENLAQRSDELTRSVRQAHPDFVQTQAELLEGDPPRIHMEGTLSLEGRTMHACFEVLPVRGMSILLLLLTQKKSGNTFRALADGIREHTKVLKKPAPAAALSAASFDVGGVIVRLDLVEEWRPVLDVEKTFVTKELMEDGLYADSRTLEKAVMLARPTLLPFSPTLTLRSAEGAVPANEGNLDRFRALYDDRIGATSPSFELLDITVEKVGGVKAFMARGLTKRAGLTVETRQLFIPQGSRTVIATLSSLAAEGEESCAGCGRLLESMSFDVEPSAAAAPPGLPEMPRSDEPSLFGNPLPWAAAAVALVLLAILGAVRIRRGARREDTSTAPRK